MRGSWRIGRIGGVDIRVDPSWAFIAILLTFTLWQQFSDQIRFPGMRSGLALGLAILTAGLVFGSILLHELAHAGMSKARQIPVSGITLYLFGGATHAKVEARRPVDEFLVTVVGPGTTLALGGLFLALHALTRSWLDHPVRAIFGYLALVNIIMGGFNLLPGFPLDGGRLLRSGLWRATGSLSRATRIAARVGQIVGLAIVATGILITIRTNEVLAGAWPVLIGWFLYRAASATLADAGRRRLLESVTVGDVMAAPPPTVDASLPVGVVTDGDLEGHEGEAFPVVRDQHVVGFVSLRTTRGVAPDRTVQEAMVGGQGVLEAAPEESMVSVIERAGEVRGRTILVVEGGRLVGVIEPEDLARFLARRASPPARPDVQPS